MTVFRQTEEWLAARTSRGLLAPGSAYTIELPWPPTLNNNKYGNHHLTTEHRAFRAEVKRRVDLRPHSFGDIRLWAGYIASPFDKRRCDISNIVKPIEDALQLAGLFIDDSQIDHFQVSRIFGPSRGTVTVTVRPF